MTLWSACIPTGIASTLMIGPFIAVPFGWRGLWLAGTGQVIAVTALLVLLLPRSRTEQPLARAPRLRMRDVGSRRLPLLFAVVAGCYMFLFSLTALFPVMLLDRFGLRLQAASELIAPVIVTGLFGGLFVRRLSDRGVPHWCSIVICGVLMAGAGIGIFAPITPLTGVYGLCIIFAALAGMLPAIAFEGAAANAGNAALVPIAMGTVMQASNMGVFVGPLVFGAIIAKGGWAAATGPLLATIAVLLAAALVLRSGARAP